MNMFRNWELASFYEVGFNFCLQAHLPCLVGALALIPDPLPYTCFAYMGSERVNPPTLIKYVQACAMDVSAAIKTTPTIFGQNVVAGAAGPPASRIIPVLILCQQKTHYLERSWYI